MLGHLAPRASDMLVARGERIAAAILTAALTRAGRRATLIDPLRIISTDGHHGGPRRI